MGKSTKVRPINEESEVNNTRHQETLDRYNGFENKKNYVYNGEKWRDECRNRDVDYAPGTYVRHPSYSQRFNSGQGSSNHEDRGRSSRHNADRDDQYSTDSNRSYDYRYDY